MRSVPDAGDAQACIRLKQPVLRAVGHLASLPHHHLIFRERGGGIRPPLKLEPPQQRAFVITLDDATYLGSLCSSIEKFLSAIGASRLALW